MFPYYVDREQALRRQFGQAKQQIVTLQEQCAEQERMCAAARADCKDVLRLVDIMSASPAGIKNVLEAYLKKLGNLDYLFFLPASIKYESPCMDTNDCLSFAGEATGSVPVKFGMGPDGRQLAISERISIALKIKREQDQLLAAQTGEGNSDAPEVAGSGAGAGAVGNRLRAESARSAGSSSIAGAGASTSTSKRGAPGGKALERQQEAYQAFKNKLSTRVGQASSAPSNDTSSHPTEGDGEEVEKEEGEEAGEDFAEYASPQKQQQEDRKTASSSSAGLSSRRSAENKSEEKPGQMQASLASEIATDWVECLDPRSKRKYYYSAALKKSTWVKPGNFAPPSSATKATAAASVLSSMTVTMPSRYASPNVSMNYSGRGSPGYAQEQAAQSSSGGGGRMTAGELQSEEGVGHNTTAAHARALLMTSPTTSTSNSHSSTGGGGGHSSAGRRQAGGGDDLQQQQSPMRSASPFSTVSLTSATSAASADFSAVFTTKSKGDVIPSDDVYV